MEVANVKRDSTVSDERHEEGAARVSKRESENQAKLGSPHSSHQDEESRRGCCGSIGSILCCMLKFTAIVMLLGSIGLAIYVVVRVEKDDMTVGEVFKELE